MYLSGVKKKIELVVLRSPRTVTWYLRVLCLLMMTMLMHTCTICSWQWPFFLA